ncbi:MAG TPA: hypothetical protein VMW01_16410 [Williamwhitmania sp.]|nr:hypothetical protein [Williamwhitmania sp.]
MSTPYDNLGGITSLDISGISNILLFTEIGNSRAIQFHDGKAWTSLPFSYGSAMLSEEPNDSDAGELLMQKVVFRLPGINADNLQLLVGLRNTRVVAKLGTESGAAIVMGSVNFPATVTYRTIPGALASDYSGYEVTIQAKSTTPMGLLVL